MHQAAAQYEWGQGQVAQVRSHTEDDIVGQFCAEYGVRKFDARNWSGRRLKERADVAEVPYWYYRYQSDVQHNAPAVLAHYVDCSTPDALVLCTDPEPEETEAHLRIACAMFAQCFAMANEHFHLGLELELAEIHGLVIDG